MATDLQMQLKGFKGGLMNKISIYVAAHKNYNVQRIPCYIPIQVGAAINEKLPFIGDDTGDNISAKNPHYS